MTNETTFGSWLKKRRRQQDLTQSELAERAGCSVTTVRKIEQDARRPSKQLAELMAEALNIPSDQLQLFITFARSNAHTVESQVALAALGQHQSTTAQLASADSPSNKQTLSTTTPSFLNEGSENHNNKSIFVGMEAELSQLSGYLKQSLNGQPNVVFVTGEAGRGKSSLLNVFAKQAQAETENLIVAKGNCAVYTGVGDVLLPFRDIFNMLTGDIEGRWRAGKITRSQALQLWQLLPHTVETLVRFGPDLIDSMVDGSGIIQRSHPYAAATPAWLNDLIQLIENKRAIGEVADRNLLFAQVTTVLSMLAAHRPLLLILDDMHWADLPSISLLAHLGRRLGHSSILILVAYRPEDVALGRNDQLHPLIEIHNEFKRQFGEKAIHLNKQANEQGRDFVDSYLDAEPNDLDDEFRSALLQRTGGQPLFTVEFLRDLKERGYLFQTSSGIWQAKTNQDWDSFPARIEGVIETRLSRLFEESLKLLTVASVEGEVFTVEILAHVLDRSPGELTKKLSGALRQKHQLVKENGFRHIGSQRITQYRFGHNLFQQYLYSRLSEFELAYMHEDVGLAIEAVYEGQTELVAVQLARHFKHAGRPEKTARYLRQAGELASNVFAYEEAVGYFTQALALTSNEQEEYSRILTLRAQAFGILTRRDAQRADIEKLLTVAKSQNDFKREVEALIALADFLLIAESWGVSSDIKKLAAQAVELAEPLDDPILQARTLYGQGKIAQQGQDSDEWRKGRIWLKKAATLFNENSFHGDACSCWNVLVELLCDLGNYSEAETYARQSLDLSRTTGNRRQEAASLRSLASVYRFQDNLDQALLTANSALEINLQMRDQIEEAKSHQTLGLILYSLERGEEALAQFWRSIELSEPLGLARITSYTHTYIIELEYRQQGRYQEALAFSDQRAAVAQKGENSFYKERISLSINYQKSELLEYMGQYEEALEIGKLVVPMFKARQIQLPRIQSWVWRLHAQAGYIEEAERQLDATLEQAPSDRHVLFNAAYIGWLRPDPAGWQIALERADKAITKIKGLGGYFIPQYAFALDLGARLALLTGEIEKAASYIEEAMKMIASVQGRIHGFEHFYFTQSCVLRSRGEHEKANASLQIAADWVMRMARLTEDETLRNSWLNNVRYNREIMAEAKVQGLIH